MKTSASPANAAVVTAMAATVVNVARAMHRASAMTSLLKARLLLPMQSQTRRPSSKSVLRQLQNLQRLQLPLCM